MKQQLYYLIVIFITLVGCTKKTKEVKSNCRLVTISGYSNNNPYELKYEYDFKNRLISLTSSSGYTFYHFDESSKKMFRFGIDQNNDTTTKVFIGYLNDNGYYDGDSALNYKYEYDSDNNLIRIINLKTNTVSTQFTWQNGNCISSKSYDDLKILREEITYSYNQSVLNSFRFEHFEYSNGYGSHSKNAPSAITRIQYYSNQTIFARSEFNYEYTYDTDGKATSYNRKMQQYSKDVNGNEIVFSNNASVAITYDKCGN